MGWRRRLLSHLHHAGYDLQVSRPNVVDFLKSREIAAVFDVGANTGQYGRLLRDDGYRGRIISFEPIKAAFEQLQQQAAADQDWSVYNFGLGSKTETLNIQVTNETVLSSILPQTQAGKTLFGQISRVAYTEEIEIRPLDAIFESHNSKACFLKIDTQGFERQVLEGAERSLASIAGVQLELPVLHLYQGVWSLCDGINFMDARGFVLGQIFPVTYHPDDPGAVIDIDCVFRRKGPMDTHASVAQEPAAIC
jgi:FkbM family methyltransferase